MVTVTQMLEVPKMQQHTAQDPSHLSQQEKTAQQVQDQLQVLLPKQQK